MIYVDNVQLEEAKGAKGLPELILQFRDELVNYSSIIVLIEKDGNVYYGIEIPLTEGLYTKANKQPDPDYGRVISVVPETVTVHVEEYMTKPKVPVSIRSTGEVPDGWEISYTSVTPQMISVYGPADAVRAVNRASVYVDLDVLEWKEGTTITVCDIHLFDSDSREEIRNPALTLSDEGVAIEKAVIECTMNKIPELVIAPAGTISETNKEDDAVIQRLYLFLQYWNVNNLEKMLTVCTPSWVSGQENPRASLFRLLELRIPVYIEIQDMKGSNQDNIRQIAMKCEFYRRNDKETEWDQLLLTMVEEDNQWYVDPVGLQTDFTVRMPAITTTPTPDPLSDSPIDVNTVLYYNPNGGSLYHLDPNCRAISSKYLPMEDHFTYGQLNDPEYSKYEPCSVCNAPLR